MQLLKRFLSPFHPEANKLSGNTKGANTSIEQKMFDLHQPIKLFMVDNIPFILEFIPDVYMPIVIKLLLENGFNIL